MIRVLRFATWSLFALAVSSTGAASFLLVLGFPGFAREVFGWAQQSALMCGACFGLLSLLELENRVRDLEDRLPTRSTPLPPQRRKYRDGPRHGLHRAPTLPEDRPPRG